MKNTSFIPSPLGEKASGMKKSSFGQSLINKLISAGRELQLLAVIIKE